MKRGLFLKYVVLFVGLVTGVLVINAALDLYFVYQDNRRASIEVQKEKAEAAAQKIESFVREIELQIAWVTQAQWAAMPIEQRRIEYFRLLRQAPAIIELVQLDRQGREQLRVSRISIDVIGSDIDRSAEPAFVEAMANRVYFGTVHFRQETEPWLTMAVAHDGKSAVTVAEVNLKLIQEVVSQIKVGKEGYAYVVDRLGRLVTHPDLSLVLRATDMSGLAQVALALAPQGREAAPVDAPNRAGVSVLSAHAAIPALNWLVFVEVPTAEVQQPVVDAGLRALALLVLGLLIAGGAAALLARRMVVPIRAMQQGAERVGGGELGHRLSIKTGDELEALAEQFNRSAAALEESYAGLEKKVEERTQALTRSIDELTASSEILRLIASAPDDLEPMFETLLDHATRLCGAQFGILWLREGDGMIAAALRNVPAGFAAYLRQGIHQFSPNTAVGQTLATLAPVQVEDVRASPSTNPMRRATADLGGARTLMTVPMLRKDQIVGVLAIFRQEVRPFDEAQTKLVATFADQAVIAIENSRLLAELRSRTTELSESLENQTAMAEVLRVISQSPTDVQPVLNAVVEAARRFCGAGDALIVLRDGDDSAIVAHEGPLTASLGRRRPVSRDNLSGRAMLDGLTVHVPDSILLDPKEYADAQAMAREHKWRAAVAAPMLREGAAAGAIMLRKIEPGAFTPRQIELLETFAAQAVIAIENVRLFTEIQEKSRQLEVASQHKSQFLANMSHELRTPLNAIIGYTEMMADGLYGEVPEKAQGVLERVQSNSRHLLGLINDVLDLTKIEAGQLVLAIEGYSVVDMVATVLSATESLARARNLKLGSAVAPGLPTGTGDARRLTQVLLNLVGNAIKFTDQGGVEIRAAQAGGRFELSVVDSGPGIAPADQARIFDEFQQVDNTSTRKTGGTGLGLSISRHIVELHGGRITVDSEIGKGSTFKISIPINAQPVRDAAQ
jgi:signal transduction histidine kinase/HAMP domain-containing protein